MAKARKKAMTIEDLALITAHGFSDMEGRLGKRIDGVEERLTKRIDTVEANLSQQITGLANRIDDLALNRATRDELLILDKRMTRVESRLGIPANLEVKK